MSAFNDNFGKINSQLFKELLLPKSGKKRKEVSKGPAYGVDVSVIELGDNRALAVSSDPLSLIPSLGLKESAWLSVHLLVNDMATTGFAPQYAQFVLNLSPGVSRETFEEFWGHIHHFCRETGVSITGGHTGQIEGQESTIPGGGTMFLTAPADHIITSDGAEPGDVIIATKEAALISSSILAMSFPETVKNKLGEEVLEKARENFYRTSVLEDALTAAGVLKPNKELKAMHDVTEGGLLGAICEMARASGCGFEVENEKIPVEEVPRKITGLFEIDPRYCVGAGSMIIAIKPGTEKKLLSHFESKSIPAAVVGRMTPKDSGFKNIVEGKEKEVTFDGTDPYWGAFFKALNEGWK